jgi:hypothetical protein
LKDVELPPPEILEPLDGNYDCCIPEKSRYVNKIIKVIMRFDSCTLELSFVIDKDMVLESIETENVHDFKLFINGEEMDFETDIKFINGDEIMVKITRDDEFAESGVTLIGYDPEVKFDTQNLPESSLDEPVEEEDILINPKE